SIVRGFFASVAIAARTSTATYLLLPTSTDLESGRSRPTTTRGKDRFWRVASAARSRPAGVFRQAIFRQRQYLVPGVHEHPPIWLPTHIGPVVQGRDVHQSVVREGIHIEKHVRAALTFGVAYYVARAPLITFEDSPACA